MSKASVRSPSQWEFIDILEECDENGYPIGSIVTADLDPQLLREYLKDK